MKESEKIYKEIEYKKGVFAIVCINDENYKEYEDNIIIEIRKLINDNLDKEIEKMYSLPIVEPKPIGIFTFIKNNH